MKMTANEIRNQKISNTRLAWLVYGNKYQGTFEDFTKEELKLIAQVEEDEGKLILINRLIQH